MAITYTVDRDEKLITEIWTGDVHAADLRAHWTTYLKDPEVLSIRRTLVDVRLAVLHISAYELSVLVGDIVLPALFDKRWKWKTAIVVSDVAQFEVSRKYQAMANLYSKDAIFDTVEQARTWLFGRESLQS